MWIFVYAYLFAVSALISWGLTFGMRALALRTGFVDMPKANKAHSAPTPLLGGVAVAGSCLAVAAGHWALMSWGPGLVERWAPNIWALFSAYRDGLAASGGKLALVLGCGAAFCVLGLIDDRVVMSASGKLVFQVLILGVLVAGGFRLSLGTGAPDFVAAGLTFFWMLAVVNAFNLLDNVDGLCSGVGAITALMILILSYFSSQVFVAALAAAVSGALAGFLFHNFPPARIFLGDAGSLFTGYMMAVLSVVTTYYHPAFGPQAPVAAFLPLILMALPLFDTLSVIVIRVSLKKPVYIGDRNHFSHRLMRLGLNARQTVLFLYFVALMTGLGGVLLLKLDRPGSFLLLLQTVAVFCVIALLEYLGKKNRE